MNDKLDLKDIAKKILKILNDTGNISDGYHTFNESYHHRMILFSLICKIFKENSWRSKLHHDNTMFDKYFIVGINTIEGQYSYHYNIQYWNHFEGVKVLERAPEYDGHKPEDIQRLERLLSLLSE